MRAHGKKEWTLSELQAALLDEVYILEMGLQAEPTAVAHQKHPFIQVQGNQFQQPRASHDAHFVQAHTLRHFATLLKILSSDVRWSDRISSATIALGTTECPV